MKTKLTCPQCGGTIVGRSDKKFCSAICKANFHNNSRMGNSFRREVNHMLLHNYKILYKWVQNGSSMVHRSALESLRYKFEFFTQMVYTPKGVYFFVYDVGFCPIFKSEGAFALIVPRKEFVSHYTFDPWS